MTKRPRLSIITPSFNQGEFIADTFESVLKQRHTAFDIDYIVMDGGSTDATKQVATRYKARFARAGIDFTFVSQPDRGQTDAINKGMRKATGDVLTYLNSDDYYEPNVLDAVMQFFQSQPQLFWAYGGWHYVNRTGQVYSTVVPKIYSYDKLLDYCVIGQPSCFFRREAFEQMGPFDETLHLGMDYEYWLRLSTRYPAGIIPDVISNMRYYGGTKSGSQATKHLIEAFKLSTRYTKAVSWKRLIQLFYFLRGYVVIVLGIDITRRIERGG